MKSWMEHRLGHLSSALRYRQLLTRTRGLLQREQHPPRSSLGLFILSAGRSGSTLLRRMLQAHPMICIPPESEDLMVRLVDLMSQSKSLPVTEKALAIVDELACMRLWGLDRRSIEKKLNATIEPPPLAELLTAVHATYRDQYKPAAEILGDKTPYLIWYMDLLRMIFPSALIILMIRHPLDAISSLIRLDATKHDLEIATNRWIGAARIHLKQLRKDRSGKILEIMYEDLVSLPALVLGSICGRLQLTFDPRMVNDRSQDLGDTILAHHHAVSQPVTTASIGVWRERLTKEQVEYIWNRCGGFAKVIGYSKEGSTNTGGLRKQPSM